MSITQNEYPRLLADIGGTNARFAIEFESGIIKNIEVLQCKDYETIVDAVKAYLKDKNLEIKHAAFAMANPVTSDYIQMTNNHWAFSISTTRLALKLETLLVLNDFTAQALAITKLKDDELVQVGGSFIEENSPKAVLGPGTGLGVSGLIPSKNGYIALSGEGGHVSFAPFDEIESMIWHYAKNKFGHVSAERLLSGMGLELIYEALAHKEGINETLSASKISELALSEKSALCRLSLDIFCAMLGTIASNLALTLGARGGVYICGGIIPKILEYFKHSSFRARFENKGRFDSYLAAIPVFVVLSNYPGINGASVALENHLKDKNVK